MKKIVFLLIVGALFVGNGSQLHAQILNGSFSTGDFTDWTTAGGTSSGPTVVTSGATPPTGTTAALIQSTDGDSSGAQSAQVGPITTTGTIDEVLGVTLPPTTNSNPLYDTGTFTPDNGQAIYQTFSVSTASTLTFAYSYQTNDGYPYDSVGYVLDGRYTQLVQTPPYPSSSTPTPYTFVAPLSLSAGPHTLASVAYNTNGRADSPSLYVTDVSTSAVPEPGEWALMILGGLGLLWARKLRLGLSG